MSFQEWLHSSYPNPVIDGRYGVLHILTGLLCVLAIVLTSVLLKNKSMGWKRSVLGAYAALILFFEITRRVINLCLVKEPTTSMLLYILLPRPGCAISCWLIILSTVINKRSLYNTTSLVAIFCGLAFFAHPAAGFNNEYILFENLYSIATHALLLITAVCYVTCGLARYESRSAWRDLLGVALVFAYAALEIWGLKIEADPLYFMPGGEVQTSLGLAYPLFLFLYIAAIAVYAFLFYFIPSRLGRSRR